MAERKRILSAEIWQRDDGIYYWVMSRDDLSDSTFTGFKTFTACLSDIMNELAILSSDSDSGTATGSDSDSDSEE